MKKLEFLDLINSAKIKSWSDISRFLDNISATKTEEKKFSKEEFDALVARGIGFITYDFGIDGVSIEIFKYAENLEEIFTRDGQAPPMHFIGGDFHDKVDVVLKKHWKRCHIPGINGWSKWYDGKYFSKLYYEDMPEGSEISHSMAVEMWAQACRFADTLATYLEDNNINLLIPVNIPTNPGNFAIMLAVALTTEALGTCVISSNHDYYWEGGKSAAERAAAGEEKGVRDHFFKNVDNKEFFALFKRLYPWNGKRWLQVNINTPQSEELVNTFGFDPKRVFEIGTAISDEFFVESSSELTAAARRKMNYIISDGKEKISTKSIYEHIEHLGRWMQAQKPLACGVTGGIELDLAKEDAVYCLQPTRVIMRKRIEKDFHLLKALMQYPKFRKEFEADQEKQLILHITGPVPIEHQADLERVLHAYVGLCQSVPENIAGRIFIVFSVGTENHPCFKMLDIKPLCIEEIYQLATVILFPSETEGRGLPIIESSAGGIPIICSRYYPEEVFAEVVGEKLPDEEQIRYLLFPEGEDFSNEFLDSAGNMMLNPAEMNEWKAHNKQAVRLRYGSEMIRRKFRTLIESLRTIC